MTMNLPMQTQPVQRALVTYSSADAGGHVGPSGFSGSPNGVLPSEYGVGPSFDWGDLLGTVAKVAVPLISSFV
jgi:hypothetical protein